MKRFLCAVFLFIHVSLLAVNSEAIDHLYARYNQEIISRAEIEQWVSQFENEDQETAISLLNHVEFYTFNRVIQESKELHAKVLNHLYLDGFIGYPEKEIQFQKVDFSKTYCAKSGDLISYFYRNANKIRSVAFKNISDLKNDPSEKSEKALVILEDYIGTGTQFLLENYGDKHAELFNQYKKVYLVVLVANSQAIDRFERIKTGDYLSVAQDFITILSIKDSEIQHSFIEKVKSISPEKLQLIYLREEKTLHNDKIAHLIDKYSTKSYMNGHFSNGLTAFFYNAPNNLPEILWNTKTVTKNGKPWIPLFKRLEDISIYRSSQFIPIEEQVW